MVDDKDLQEARASATDDERRGLMSSAGGSLAVRTRDLMRRYDLRPRKSLGQNFLLNPGKVEQIAASAVQAAERAGTDLVIEIGSGLGALTMALLAFDIDVVAFEIDRRLEEPLLELTAEQPRVKLLVEDFLQADLAQVAGGRAYVAAGNLPYQITAPLLEKLFWDERCRALVITVQREVGDRLRAQAGTKQYGPLTLFCQYHVDAIEVVTQLSPGDFLPPPQISSTALRLVKRTEPPFERPSAEQFSRTVRAAFIHRRKALRAGLTAAPQLSLSREQVGEALDLAGLQGERRAETLTMGELARLAIAIEEVERA